MEEFVHNAPLERKTLLLSKVEKGVQVIIENDPNVSRVVLFGSLAQLLRGKLLSLKGFSDADIIIETKSLTPEETANYYINLYRALEAQQIDTIHGFNHMGNYLHIGVNPKDKKDIRNRDYILRGMKEDGILLYERRTVFGKTQVRRYQPERLKKP